MSVDSSRRGVGRTALAMALIALAVTPAAAHASFPGTNGDIAYQGQGVSGVSDWSIFSMNPDGSGKINLTPNPASAPARRGGAIGSNNPAYSADGRKIVFQRISQGQSHSDIWVMNADGSGAKDITNTATVSEYNPSFLAGRLNGRLQPRSRPGRRGALDDERGRQRGGAPERHRRSHVS